MPQIRFTPKSSVRFTPAKVGQKPSGASGSWEAPPSKLESAARTVIDPFARLGKGAVDAGKAVAHFPADFLKASATPGGLAHMALDPQLAESDKAIQKMFGSGLGKRNYLDSIEAIGHGTAAALPFLGPLAAHLGERIGGGDTMGAIGEGLVYLMAPKAIGEVKGLASGGFKAGLNAVTSPDALMTRAASNRAFKSEPLPPGTPLTVRTAKAAWDVTRTPRARLQETLAKGIAEKGPAVSISAPKQQIPSIERPVTTVPIEQSRRLQAPAYEPFPNEPIGAVRPQPPNLSSELADAKVMNAPQDFIQKPPVEPVQQIEMATLPESSPAPAPPKFTPRDINKWMNVSPKDLVHGATPAEQIINDGLLVATKDATRSNVKAALDSTGKDMESLFKSHDSTKVNAEPLVIDALDEATKTIGKRTDPAFQNALDNILSDILHKHPNLGSMSPSELHALKVDVGDAITWGKGAGYEADLNGVLRKIYGSVNDQLKAAVPEAAGLQSKWGNLYTANKALTRSMLKDAVGSGTGDVPKSLTKTKPSLAQHLSRTEPTKPSLMLELP